MQKLALALLISSAAIVSASAADQIAAEETPIGFNWTGAYLGAQIGYGWGKSDAGIAPCPLAPTGCALNFDPDGFFGGVYVGYNHQLSNNIVLGIDADISLSAIDSGDVVMRDGAGAPLPLVEGSSKVKWDGAIRARLGYAMDRWLPYVAGGVSVARYDMEAHLVSPFFIYPAGTSLASESRTLTGWNIGAGVEYAATDKITIRAEYRYTDFGTDRFHIQNNILDTNGRVDLNTHDIRLGVAYRF